LGGAVLGGCSGASPGPGAGPTASKAPSGPGYYLALGDSLARGVQPDASGDSVETAQGYPNRVYARLRAAHPGLRLALLGCPGETTATMTRGGICRYPGGSQLAAAAAVLRAPRGHVLLVTLDIGANDIATCESELSLQNIGGCSREVSAAAANLAAILARLRAAAGSGVPVVGMNYYLPALSVWRTGLSGQLAARVAEKLLAAADGMLDRAYTQAGDAYADIFTAFGTSDFGDPVTVAGLGALPRNVARVCQWTWACTAPPRGPNEHANAAGYQVIADAVLGVARLS
jgi:lysophospholipase L1-like esterase